jgi:hypothetical protein
MYSKKNYVKIINFENNETYKSLINRWIIVDIIDNKYLLKNSKVRVAYIKILIKNTVPIN